MAKHLAAQPEKKRISPIKVILKLVLCVLLVAVAAVGSYVAYLSITYYRIDDGVSLDVTGPATAEAAQIEVGQPYTAVTYNIGFGAYVPDFSFFMETGVMADGTATRGASGTASSEDVVHFSTDGVIGTLQQLDPDFIIAQEVDVDSTRSYHVDQCAALMGAFPTYQAVFASNFHSGFLAYPFHDMHGSVQSGLLTLSSVQVSSATRRSYPIDESFPWKFFDLDRCFSVTRIPTSDGHELVLVNTHMSAYDEGGVYRAKQLDLMLGFLTAERAAGNYVIAGGDWNHALAGSRELYPSAAAAPDWVATFDDDLLPEGFSVVRAENLEDVATCRGSDMPYEPGVSYEVTVDGFIVSDNVSATAVNVDAGFAYSDHNPVLLTFELVG
ncbi:MAG: endonuclease [Coriobacteriaceae bacterium]|nr:endonuclease [Coriobacteriaceae bacterium]